MKRISITRLFFAIVVLMLQLGIRTGIAEETSTIGVFSLPYDLRTLSGTNARPLTPYVNRFSECLPGVLYDAKEIFIKHGVKFGPDDFALFSLTNKTLIVKAAPSDVRDVEELSTAVCYCPPLNVIVEGQIQVKGNKTHQESRWRISSKSGTRCDVSAKGSGGMEYSIEYEPIVNPDGETLDCSIQLKISHKGRQYQVANQFSTSLGKTYSILVGTTAKGEQIRFELTPTLEPFVPVNPYDDPKKKAQLIECIKKHLAEEPPTSANTAPSTAPRQ